MHVGFDGHLVWRTDVIVPGITVLGGLKPGGLVVGPPVKVGGIERFGGTPEPGQGGG